MDEIILDARVVLNIAQWIESQTGFWDDMKIKVDVEGKEILLWDEANHIRVSTRPFSYFEGE